MRRRGFTLIEMLVVLAITSVLLGIILIPIVHSFNFTRAAQGFADAQEKGRRLIESIQREISQAASVRDNDGDRGTLAVVVPGQDGTPVTVLMPYTKLDLYKPAQGDPSLVRDNAYVDPETGVADPTRRVPAGQVVLPVAPGMSIVRYFIGLNRPLAANNLDPARYIEPYSGLLMNRSGDRDNLYVLYRAEVQPIVFRNGQFEVNTALFADDDNNGQPDDLDDPYFFVQDPPGIPALPAAERAAKAQRIANWRNAATVITEFSRYDMIQPVYNRATRQVVYSNNVPQLASLIQFKPTGITREPARGQAAVRLGDETDNGSAISPDVYSTDFGNWSAAIVRLFPVNYDASLTAQNHYMIARFDARASDRRLRVYRYDPDLDADGDDRNGEDDPLDDLEIFDIGAYEQWTSRGLAFPFSRGMAAANTRSNWMSTQVGRDSFIPFYVDQLAGKIYTGFAISDVGVDDPSGGTTPPANDNLPARDTGPFSTPTNDPVTPGNFYDATYANINRLFTKVWNDQPALQGPALHRFIDLRVTANADGTLSPLHPQTATINALPPAQVVPGSEIVIGPDQNPGPNYGNAIRYTRVTANPGRNQYRINYTNLVEPNYALLGLAAPPAVYDPQNFMSAVYQPRYKAGYVQLNSDQNDALPTGSVSVFYKFQFVQPKDSLTVDYDSREMISVLLTIKNFAQTTLPNPQLITLKATAPVRNYVR